MNENIQNQQEEKKQTTFKDCLYSKINISVKALDIFIGIIFAALIVSIIIATR
ncbi:hypothetical protein RBG61_07450 [Paludicola sp. MB14-C6]|uniref:hypothetical protein n=1 Tax=Paludihabitans sp. MB14-C6 TaxID=3070656 RepID=UPI0027DD106A|nr:hypothetical protein [Paludicola sp. MB14-C6]WMJ21839.1 hypothetical protein RBG61_07450 [Paludicola sp. MB14-C6]